MSTKISRARFLLGLAFAFLLAACLLAALPSAAPRAWAAEAAFTRVDIRAQVETDASLRVFEQRTASLADAPSVLCWDFEGLSEGVSENTELCVVGVRAAAVDAAGNLTSEWAALPESAFVLDWREEGGPAKAAWSFDSPKEAVYVFLDEALWEQAAAGAASVAAAEGASGEEGAPDEEGASGESAEGSSAADAADAPAAGGVVVELEYVVRDAVAAYEDVAELSWRFVSESWPADSQNVALNVVLPVPAGGAAVPGSNVFAWGHGPADGSLAVKADGSVVYADALVPAGQYLDARVLFPVDWLANASSSVLRAHQGEVLLESAQEAEENWADSDSGWLQGRLGTFELMAFATAGVVAAALVLYLAFGRPRKPDFTDDLLALPASGAVSPGSSEGFFLDDWQPAVLGRLMRWNRESFDDFAAAVLDLERAGALRIGRGSYRGPAGEMVKDFYIKVVPEVAAACADPLERATLNLLFTRVAEGAPSLWTGTVRAWAKEHPLEWLSLAVAWQGVLSAQVESAGFFETACRRARPVMFAAAGLLLVAGVGASASLGSPVPAALMLPAAFAVLVLANYLQRRTPRGNNLAARCKAAFNWLCARGGAERVCGEGRHAGGESGCACCENAAPEAASGAASEEGALRTAAAASCSRERLLILGWLMGDSCGWERARAADAISASLAEATESARAARL